MLPTQTIHECILMCFIEILLIKKCKDLKNELFIKPPNRAITAGISVLTLLIGMCIWNNLLIQYLSQYGDGGGI